MEQVEIKKVRASVHQQCGSRVKIQLDRGRNKVDIQEGVIQQAYPSVFTVLVDDDKDQNPPQLLSFSYRYHYKRYKNEALLILVKLE